MITRIGYGIVLLIALSMSSFADEPHIHGTAHMDVSVENKKIEIEFKGAFANFLSFEHAPETEAERAEINLLNESLKDSDKIFQLASGAECVLVKKSVELDGISHDRNHGRKKGHENLNLEIEMKFLCQDIASLKKIKVPLFTLFPNLKKIEARWITAEGQGASSLTPTSSTLNWK